MHETVCRHEFCLGIECQHFAPERAAANVNWHVQFALRVASLSVKDADLVKMLLLLFIVPVMNSEP